MKRRVVCAFSLLFWLILLCTVFSARVEQLMMPVVEIEEFGVSGPDVSISADALFYDESGAHLYGVSPGFGWESGMRVYEASADSYSLSGTRLWNLDMGRYVLYATRAPDLGGLVEIREEPFLYMDDTWVAVYPDGVTAYSLPRDNMSVSAQTDTALLIAAPGADYPFMADRARTSLEKNKDEAYYEEPPNCTVYSLNDLYRFADSLLLLAALAVAVLLSLAVWWRCCGLSRDRKKNRRALLLHIGLGALLLVCILLIAQLVDMPSSLLPKSRITDFGYYATTCSALFSALHALAAQGGAAAGEAVRYAESRVLLASLIVLAGALLSMGKIVLGGVRMRSRRKPKPRHAAW